MAKSQLRYRLWKPMTVNGDNPKASISAQMGAFSVSKQQQLLAAVAPAGMESFAGTGRSVCMIGHGSVSVSPSHLPFW